MHPYSFQMSVYRKTLIFLLALAVSSLLLAQPTASNFMKHYEGGDVEYAYGGAQLPDGTYIISGMLGWGLNGTDGCLMKLDAGGNQIWTRSYGGPSGEQIYDVVPTRDGGLAFTGHTQSFGSGASDLLIGKTDTAGTVLWARAFGGTANEYGVSVDTASDGGIVVAGYTYSFGAGNADFMILKFSSAGAFQWSRVIGGPLLELPYEIIQTQDGGFLISGITLSFGAGSTDIYLVKLDDAGNLRWTRTFGGPSGDTGTRSTTTSDGQYVIASYTNSFGFGGTDGMLLKIRSNGNLNWARTYGSGSLDRFFDVFETSSLELVATGEGSTNTFGAGDQQIVRVDSLGNILWARHYGTPVDETGYGVSLATQDGGILLTGWDDNDEDLLVSKTDSNGLMSCNTGPMTISTTNPVVSVDSGGTVTMGGTSVNVALPHGLLPLTEITYCSTILPVEIQNFSGIAEPDNNRLAWELYDFGNASHQFIEREISENQFIRIGDLKVNPAVSEYEFREYNPGPGPWRYRLSIRDQNGHLHRSSFLEIHPHSAKSTLSIYFPGARMAFSEWDLQENGSLRMMDMQGRTVQTLRIPEGVREITLPKINHSAGCYLVELRQAQHTQRKRIFLAE